MHNKESFRCCICGHENKRSRSDMHREVCDCSCCESSPRSRGVALAVMKGICADASVPFELQRPRKDLRVVGMSDGSLIERIMTEKFDYTNTFFHKQPFLDLCSQVSAANYKDLDIIICSDVLEHTFATPIEVLPNLRQMLRPGGLLILTVPTNHMPNTIEWYGGAVCPPVPEKQELGSWVVRWSDRRGNDYIDQHPSFHGGPGDTLEMRMISHSQIAAEGKRCGFEVSNLEFKPDAGYYWSLLVAENHFDRRDARVFMMRRES